MGAEKQQKFPSVERGVKLLEDIKHYPRLQPSVVPLLPPVPKYLQPQVAVQFRWPFQTQLSKLMGLHHCVITSDGHQHTQAQCQHQL